MDAIKAMNKPHTFTVHRPGHEGREVKGRLRAVEEARELSDLRRAPVIVEREDGLVRMVFEGGSLQTLRVETPNRRRRKRR